MKSLPFIIFISIENQKEIVIIVVVTSLILGCNYLYRKLKSSDVLTKHGRERIEIKKKIEVINKNLNELEDLLKKNIINTQDFNNKVNELNVKKRELEVSSLIKNEDKYSSIVDAFNKGLINKIQYEKNIDSLKHEIEIKNFKPIKILAEESECQNNASKNNSLTQNKKIEIDNQEIKDIVREVFNKKGVK